MEFQLQQQRRSRASICLALCKGKCPSVRMLQAAHLVPRGSFGGVMLHNFKSGQSWLCFPPVRYRACANPVIRHKPTGCLHSLRPFFTKHPRCPGVVLCAFPIPLRHPKRQGGKHLDGSRSRLAEGSPSRDWLQFFWGGSSRDD